MTRKKAGEGAAALEEALQVLYGSGGRDLTAQGYTEALHKLRKVDAAGARRVERLLGPFLEKKVFPRRGRAWQETSEGARMRVALLPHNPHVQQDALTIRKLLGIPAGQIHAKEDDPGWKQVKALVKPEAIIGQVVEGNLASRWLYFHRQTALGLPIGEEDRHALPQELEGSAVKSALADLAAEHVPQWLRHPGKMVEKDDSQVTPIDWVAARLAERHKLPSHLAPALTFYVLTLDAARLAGLDPVRVDVAYGGGPSGDPSAFTVAVWGIDEFVTRDDWERIWKQYVEPRQHTLWKRRGTLPQGRRALGVERLRGAMPLYRKMVAEELEFKQVLALAPQDWDQETVRRVISDLRELLEPAP